MPMRTECKNFESRSYPNGDTVRKCDLDLAPEAHFLNGHVDPVRVDCAG